MESPVDYRPRNMSTSTVRNFDSTSKSFGTALLLAEDNPDTFDSESNWSFESAKCHESSTPSKLKLLSKYYQIVKKQFLPYQSQTLGLFVMDTAKVPKLNGRIKKDVHVSHMRENIYCAQALWALGRAYRLVDNDGGRTHELDNTAVKCLRGVLFCWMRQHEKVEQFKASPCADNSLNLTFDSLTGEAKEVSEYAKYPHLQLEVQSLFILTIVQVTSSGLQVIWTTDEVNFVQNLVYYIERSYRVSDFGMWERGTKYNIGEPELHASSLAMAKAALESVNGFNLFGDKGTSAHIIYVDLDAHNRNLTTLETLLPRESSSKNADFSLLFGLGYPAFALNTQKLRDATKAKILKKLNGSYGLKRFLRDGYGCLNEDTSRRYYHQSEIQKFDGVECQWPLGFVLLYINAVFAGDTQEAEKYSEMIEQLTVMDNDHDDVLPMYYYVRDEDDFDLERKNPNQVPREHSGEGRDGKIWLLGQSLFFISRLLAEGLIHPSQLDPLGRHHTRGSKSKNSRSEYVPLVHPSRRYSEFQVTRPKELCVQVCIISQSVRLQSLLATYGIPSQTPNQIEPVEICSPSELVRAYSFLATNEALGLSGRPERPMGGLSTSKVYKIKGKTVVSYPLVFQQSNFYMALDATMLVEDIRELIRFVWSSWFVAGRPLIACILREDLFNNDRSAVGEVIQLLNTFKRGHCAGVPVKLGRMQTFLSASCWESLDFLAYTSSEFKFKPADFSVVNYERELFTDNNMNATAHEEYDTSKRRRSSVRELPTDIDYYQSGAVLDLLYASSDSMQLQSKLLCKLLQKEGPDYITSKGTIKECLDLMVHIAASQNRWGVVRQCSGMLRSTVDSLAPALTYILVFGKFVTIGVFGHREELIEKTLSPDQLHRIIFDCCLEIDPREAVLQQEVLINVSKMIMNSPDLFNGMLKIRIGWIIQLMKGEYLKGDEGLTTNDFYEMSPRKMKEMLKTIMAIDVSQRGIAEQRRIDGCLNRNPFKFYDKVWAILERCPEGIQLSKFKIPQEPTVSAMTDYDLKFAMLVEDMLSVCCHLQFNSTLSVVVTMWFSL